MFIEKRLHKLLNPVGVACQYERLQTATKNPGKLTPMVRFQTAPELNHKPFRHQNPLESRSDGMFIEKRLHKLFGCPQG